MIAQIDLSGGGIMEDKLRALLDKLGFLKYEVLAGVADNEYQVNIYESGIPLDIFAKLMKELVKLGFKKACKFSGGNGHFILDIG